MLIIRSTVQILVLLFLGNFSSKAYSEIPREEIVDKLETMRSQEAFYRNSYQPNQQQINPVWKFNSIHWSFEVVDYFDISRRTVALASKYVDRYLPSVGKEISEQEFNLISSAALFLAIKISSFEKISMTEFSDLSDGAFGYTDLENMEMSILKQLDYRLYPPLARDYLHLTSALIHYEYEESKKRDLDLSYFLVELSVYDSYFFDKDQHKIAESAYSLAVMLNSFEPSLSEDTLDDTTARLFQLYQKSQLSLR